MAWFIGACRSCQFMQVVELGEAVRGRLDGMSGLLQELADVSDPLVHGLGPDAEQGGDGDLGQPEAVVEHGGEEPVGQGEDGAAAGSRACLHAGPPALVPGGLALLVVERHERGDQGVPVLGRQAGQGGVAEPGQVRAGLVERAGIAGGPVVLARAEGTTPAAAPVLAL
jgi:hypothetical protein